MEFVHTGPVAALWATVLLAVTLAGAGRLGGLVLAVIGRDRLSASAEENSLFSIGLGLLILSLAVLGLGLYQLLYLPAILALSSFLLALPFVFSGNAFSLRAMLRLFNPSKDNLIGFSAVAVIALLSWVQVSAPPIGMDALSYHLEHPKQFIWHHSIHYVPFSRESLWPYQTEMLYLFGLMVQGTGLAQLFHWAFYFLTAWAVYLLGLRFYGKKAARFGSITWLLTPAAFAQSGHAYVDLSLAFYTVTAVYLYLIYVRHREATTAVLCGLFAGAAVGTKYLGLGSAAILLLFLLADTRGKSLHALLYFLSAVLAAGIWYIRSWMILGNPFYPFFPNVFGGRGWETDIAVGVGMGNGILDFLRLPGNLTFFPVSFGGEILGPLFLLFIPLLVFYSGKSVAGLRLALFSVLYALFVFTQSQQARFFLSVVPMLSLGVGVALENALTKPGLLKKTALTAFLAVALVHMGIYAYRGKDEWGVVFGRRSASDYLANHERSYKLYDYLKENKRPDETFLNAGEVRFFYSSDAEMAFDAVPLRTHLASQGLGIGDYLIQKNFNYILLSRNPDPLIQAYVRDRGYEQVFAYRFIEKPFEKEYRLFYKKNG